MASGTVVVECSVGVETPRALHITLPDNRIVWVPWSHVKEIHRDEKRIAVTAEFALQHSL